MAHSKINSPEKVGIIHFCGIGGIGMSGIAEILKNSGYKVQGSDIAENANIERLRSSGIKIFISQRAENIENAAVIVRSSAVKDDNIEIKAARNKKIPVILRAEMLAEIMHLKNSVAIAGSHGKTTTTSLVAALLDQCGYDPTVINGGILNAYNTNAKLGKGEWLVAEADESDGSFLRLPATFGIITNIDPEHMDHYGTVEKLHSAFKEFIERLPFYGCGILCADHPVTLELSKKIIDRKIYTYAIDNKNADIKAFNIRISPQGATYDIKIAKRINYYTDIIKDVTLPMHGLHNLLNSLAAVGVAIELNIKAESIVKAFEQFKGVKRRFTFVGKTNNISIIDDYGHHPVEIAATLRTARQVIDSAKSKGKIIAVMQPHRYSRLNSLFKEFAACFTGADHIIILPVYSAGEKPIKNINGENLSKAVCKSGLKSIYLADEDLLAEEINNIAKKDDMVICLGAGSITKIAYNLPSQLALYGSK